MDQLEKSCLPLLFAADSEQTKALMGIYAQCRVYISIVLNIYTHRASHIYPPYSSYTSIDAYLIISDGLFEHILLFIGFLLFVLLLFALLCALIVNLTFI